MTEHEFVDYLNEALLQASDEDDLIRRSTTFEDAMMMTMNKGLVVRLKDGSEFQVTVVKSKSR